MAARDEFAFLAGEGAVVDVENHRQSRFVDVDFRQGFRILRVGYGFADFQVRNADDAGDFAHSGFFRFRPLQSFVRVYAADFSAALAFAVGNNDVLVRTEAAADDTADGDFTDVVVVIQGRNHELQRAVDIAFRAGAVFNDSFKQRFQIAAVVVHRIFGDAVAAVCVDDWEIELVVVGFQFHEQFQYFVFDFRNAGFGLVDFIDNYDRLQILFQRLAQYVFRLRHRAFEGVDEQQYAVNHIQNTFYFAAEIGMARRVDDIDLDAFMHDGRVFGQDRNAPFPFDIAGVHDSFGNLFIGAENVALLKHCVDQCRFAMVNVGNNCNIANILTFHLMSSLLCQIMISLVSS